MVLRCRPLSQQEVADKRKNIVHTDGGARKVVLQAASPGDATREFGFDAVFGQESTQEQVRRHQGPAKAPSGLPWTQVSFQVLDDCMDAALTFNIYERIHVGASGVLMLFLAAFTSLECASGV